MCIASKQIKLCTCKVRSVKKLPHYWALYRIHENKGLMVGEVVMPQHYFDFAIYPQSLLPQLNESDVFDQVIDFAENDNLKIVLNNLKDLEEQLVFWFEYQECKWVESGQDPFLKYNYKKIISSKVEIGDK